MDEKLIKKDCYQVFLFACPAHLPLSFAAHSWFVVNRKGEISRWEVTFSKPKRELSWGHLSKNLFSFFQGLAMLPFMSSICWKGKLLGHTEGAEGSVAHRMSELILSSNTAYPYCEKYHLVGPNSNTYVQWIVDRFPESGLRLPWNAFGKHHRV